MENRPQNGATTQEKGAGIRKDPEPWVIQDLMAKDGEGEEGP